MGDCISHCNPVFKRVLELPPVMYATRNHAYIMPSNKVYILNEASDGYVLFSDLNGGGAVGDSPVGSDVQFGRGLKVVDGVVSIDHKVMPDRKEIEKHIEYYGGRIGGAIDLSKAVVTADSDYFGYDLQSEPKPPIEPITGNQDYDVSYPIVTGVYLEYTILNEGLYTKGEMGAEQHKRSTVIFTNNLTNNKEIVIPLGRLSTLYSKASQELVSGFTNNTFTPYPRGEEGISLHLNVDAISNENYLGVRSKDSYIQFSDGSKLTIDPFRTPEEPSYTYKSPTSDESVTLRIKLERVLGKLNTIMPYTSWLYDEEDDWAKK